jgi:DNA-binding MarR family transcriptional regulator
VETTPATDEILGYFHALMQHIAGSSAPEFLGLEVTMPQAKVLYLVSLQPGMPMSAIAAELGVGSSAVTGLVDRLVALGHVERHEDAQDRRQQLVTLTEAGAVALERMHQLRSEMLRRLLGGLSASELDAVRTSLVALDREARRLAETPSPPGFALTSLKVKPERTRA